MQNYYPVAKDAVDELDMRLQRILKEQNLSEAQQAINALALRLNISLLDCAAALWFLQQPPLTISPNSAVKTKYRFVRYRLDIGSQHQVEKEQIETVLVQESGVDKKRIGKIDIRHNYTLVELPDGMPADIFQLLSEATIGDRKLAIKRVKTNRKSSKP
jgi:ATP-dependent RNA helicase DeaD